MDFRKWLVSVPLLLAVGPAYPKQAGDELEIVATADEAGGAWKVNGRILQGANSGGLQGVIVWVVASTVSGNHASFFAPALNDVGEFEVNPIPARIRYDKVVQLAVVARVPAGGRVEKLLLDQKQGSIWGTFGVSAGILVFLTSLVLPFWKGEPGHFRYVFALLLACVFTGTMLASLGMGLRRVNTPGRQDDVTPVPFGSIYQGTYSQNVSPDWLFSLTSPPLDPAGVQPPGQPQVDKGFGAPLWVLLMSVLGAGVLTISLIVGEIGNWPGDNSAEIRRRIQKVVRHQFFILAAPVGAILVYQILVAAQAVSIQFTVAIAAVGSGMTLHSLLNVAVRRAGSIIDGSWRSRAADETAREKAASAAAGRL